MRLLAEAVRAAGNVLLTPIKLTSIASAESWQRALVVGSRRNGLISHVIRELQQIAPALSFDVVWFGGIAPPGIWSARRERYDVVCLLLGGEGLRSKKITAALSGAPIVLAYGSNDRWYRLNLPPIRLASYRWWSRFTFALLLCAAYLKVMLNITMFDLLRSIFPLGPPVPESTQAGAAKRVTFIVPNFNQRHLMDFCLPPLLKEAGEEHEVMVVDDASTDDTVAYVREHYPQVRVIPLARNRGFAGAVRAGIAASKTPLFALINTDVQVRPGWLAAILPHFDRPDTFAVCSRIELPNGSQMETGNVAPAWSGVLEPYHVPPTKPGPILYAGGASSVYDRAKYDALGGFEPMYRPLYFEDIELGYRAWRHGWRSLFEPGASVLHQRRAWIGKRFGNAYANETFLKNGLLFVWKNVRDREMLAQHLAYVYARLLSEILNGEHTMAYAVLRALPLMPRVLMKRWSQWRQGDLTDAQILEIARPPLSDEPVETGAR